MYHFSWSTVCETVVALSRKYKRLRLKWCGISSQLKKQFDRIFWNATFKRSKMTNFSSKWYEERKEEGCRLSPMTEHEGGRAVQPPRSELCKTQTHLDSLSIGKQPSSSFSLPCVHVIVKRCTFPILLWSEKGRQCNGANICRENESTPDKKNSHWVSYYRLRSKAGRGWWKT